MNTEQEMNVLADSCELIFHSLKVATNENKERGIIAPGNVPVIRDLMIAYEKGLKAKLLLHELEDGKENQGETLSSSYGGNYMDSNTSYGRNQPRASNGRWMDGQSGGTYSSYGHDEAPMETLRRMAENARDQNERRAYETAMDILKR